MVRKQRFRNVGAGKGIKEQLNPDTLRRLYFEQKLCQASIARQYGCTPQFVSLLLHEYGLVPSSPRPNDRKSCI